MKTPRPTMTPPAPSAPTKKKPKPSDSLQLFSWPETAPSPKACWKIQLKGPSARQQLKRNDCGEAHVFIKKIPCPSCPPPPVSAAPPPAY